MFKRLLIRQKLILLLLFVTLIPVVCIALFTYYSARRTLFEEVIGTMTAINKLRAARINNLFQSWHEQAEDLAGTYLIRQIGGSGAPEPEFLARLEAHFGNIMEEQRLAAKSRLWEVNRKAAIEVISLLAVDGTVLAGGPHQNGTIVVPPRFLPSPQTEGPTFGGIDEDPATGNHYFMIFAPVLNWASSELSGHLLVKVRASALNYITRDRVGPRQTGTTVLIDRDFFIIADSRSIEGAARNLRYRSEETRSAFSGIQVSGAFRNYQDIPVLGSAALLGTPNWVIVTEIAVSEVLAPLVGIRNRILIFGGVFLILSLVFAVLIGRSLTRPILGVRDAAARLGAGDLDVRAEVQGHDELAELAQGFNDMAQSLSETTANLVAARTAAERAERRLRQRTVALEISNSELEQFAYIASHDLQEPLRGVKGCVEVLARRLSGQLEGKSDPFIQGAVDGVKRMQEYINGLLAFTRVTTRAGPFEWLDSGALVSTVAETFDRVIKDTGGRLEYELPFPKVFTDGGQLTQVFRYLVDNAVKFRGARPPQVSISWKQSEDEIEFSVRDRGIGIDEKDFERIFLLFQRLHGWDEYPGRGVGLAISKKIVERHGGRIRVESALGEGASFYFAIHLPDAA